MDYILLNDNDYLKASSIFKNIEVQTDAFSSVLLLESGMLLIKQSSKRDKVAIDSLSPSPSTFR
jgi:hypothetical protein